MKIIVKTISLISFLVLGLTSCEDSSSDDDSIIGTWTKRSSFEGVSRSNAACFVIGTKAYITNGFDGSNRLSDLWEYDYELNFWQQKADFPGPARSEASAFSIEELGYVGTGYDGSILYKDFYEYNPNTNSWTQKADFAGTARYSSVGFSLGELGYIGSGFDGNYKKDFWTYLPATDSWSQIVSIEGDKRMDATCFVINDKAYVLGGTNNGTYLSDLWEYDPDLTSWKKRQSLLNSDGEDDDWDIRRYGASTFVIDNYGYVSTGYYNGYTSSSFRYHPGSNTWEEVEGFSGTSRMDACGFSIDNHGFIVGGKKGNLRFDDCWRFTAD